MEDLLMIKYFSIGAISILVGILAVKTHEEPNQNHYRGGQSIVLFLKNAKKSKHLLAVCLFLLGFLFMAHSLKII